MTQRKLHTGTIAPLLAITVIALFSFVALAVDLGMLNISRTQAQNASDSAALSGCRVLNVGPSNIQNDKTVAETTATNSALGNRHFNSFFTDDGTANNKVSVQVGLYDYDTTIGRFNFKATKVAGVDDLKPYTAVRVTINQNQSAYFSKIMGVNSLAMTTVATAVHRPRDIAFILDFSGSMRFSSEFNWASQNGSNPATGGMINPDPNYPKFGHYQRYTTYNNANPTLDANASTPGNRPNPLQQTASYSLGASGVLAPNNHTIETPSGPPIIKDFFYDPSNELTPGTVVASVVPANLKNAFHRWDGVSTFNALDANRTNGPTPAPSGYDVQNAAGTFYGDRWPRKNGQELTAGESWDPTVTTGTARNLAEYLGWIRIGTSTSSYVNHYATGSTPVSTSTPVPGEGVTWVSSTPQTWATNWQSSGTDKTLHSNWENFYDATWEQYGYDLNVADYIANRGANFNPKVVFTNAQVTPGKFKGYTMGPGYWGKTFYMWPPDPRKPVGNPGDTVYQAGDWRERFFNLTIPGAMTSTGGTSTSVDPSTSLSKTKKFNVDKYMLQTGTAHTLSLNATYVTPNYTAILRFIKAPPKILPSNLRSGRVLYYSSIPDDVDTSTGSTDEKCDKAFWKNYIDFVLALNNNNGRFLAGPENRAWPEGSSTTIFNVTGPYVNPKSPWDGLYPDQTSDGNATNPRQPYPQPYVHYLDAPNVPRCDMWFGPLTMLGFIQAAKTYENWISGTAHEAQMWQLKAAINSVLDDIRNNHPNDYAGMTFFAYSDWKTARAPMSQDWSTLKNCLFYPNNLLPVVDTNLAAEVRPYNSSFSSTNVNGNIPRADGGTDPNTGFSVAYNLLSSAPSTNADPTKRGRRGATKIVIFETDGLPNAYQNFNRNDSGYDSYYTWSNTGASVGSASSTVTQKTYDVIDHIRANAISTNVNGQYSGFSLPSSPARIYSIGYGDLFDPSTIPAPSSAVDAKDFLLNVQKKGGTSAATATSFPSDQLISGNYQTRIANMRTILERIMQSGVQVTLIE